MLSLRSMLMPILVVVLPLAAAVWSVMSSHVERADLTFNNGTEVESVDPAIVTGVPEGRIIEALYEGLVKLDPKDRLPTNEGVAESWTLSDDLKTYTFKLRKEARWSNGDPVTADDFVYSMRRFLHPNTQSQYVYQGWYIENAQRFSKPGNALAVGDPVEVELNLKPGVHDTCRGEMLKGTLVSKNPKSLPDDPEEASKIQQVFTISVDDKNRKFVIGNPLFDTLKKDDLEMCRMVTLDFDLVGIKAVDEYTLETRLENPTPYWPQLVGFYPLFPVHRASLEEHGSPAWTKPENIVTNGAFLLDSRRPRDRIRLRKNPTYWNRNTVKLETIDALAIEENNTALNMYEAGELDWVTQLDGTVVPAIMDADPPRDDFEPYPQLTVYYYKLNTTRKPLNDVRVRKALALALTRQEFVDTVTMGPEEPAFSLVPPGIRGYEPPTIGKENAERARELLAEAGYPGGRGFPRLEILYNTLEQHEAIAELARKQWQRELGITITLQNEVWASYQDRLRLKEYDIGRQSWTGDYIDPNTWLDMYVTDGENNQTGWSKPEYDALIAKAMTITDDAERLEVLRQAEAMVMDEVPIVPIYFYVSRNLVKPYVRGFYNNLQDTHPLQYLWIDRSQASPNTFMNRPK